MGSGNFTEFLFTESHFTENQYTENRFNENHFTENSLTENQFTENQFTKNRFTENCFTTEWILSGAYEGGGGGGAVRQWAGPAVLDVVFFRRRQTPFSNFFQSWDHFICGLQLPNTHKLLCSVDRLEIFSTSIEFYLQ